MSFCQECGSKKFILTHGNHFITYKKPKKPFTILSNYTYINTVSNVKICADKFFPIKEKPFECTLSKTILGEKVTYKVTTRRAYMKIQKPTICCYKCMYTLYPQIFNLIVKAAITIQNKFRQNHDKYPSISFKNPKLSSCICVNKCRCAEKCVCNRVIYKPQKCRCPLCTFEATYIPICTNETSNCDCSECRYIRQIQRPSHKENECVNNILIVSECKCKEGRLCKCTFKTLCYYCGSPYVQWCNNKYIFCDNCKKSLPTSFPTQYNCKKCDSNEVKWRTDYTIENKCIKHYIKYNCPNCGTLTKEFVKPIKNTKKCKGCKDPYVLWTLRNHSYCNDCIDRSTIFKKFISKFICKCKYSCTCKPKQTIYPIYKWNPKKPGVGQIIDWTTPTRCSICLSLGAPSFEGKYNPEELGTPFVKESVLNYQHIPVESGQSEKLSFNNYLIRGPTRSFKYPSYMKKPNTIENTFFDIESHQKFKLNHERDMYLLCGKTQKVNIEIK